MRRCRLPGDPRRRPRRTARAAGERDARNAGRTARIGEDDDPREALPPFPPDQPCGSLNGNRRSTNSGIGRVLGRYGLPNGSTGFHFTELDIAVRQGRDIQKSPAGDSPRHRGPWHGASTLGIEGIPSSSRGQDALDPGNPVRHSRPGPTFEEPCPPRRLVSRTPRESCTVAPGGLAPEFRTDRDPHVVAAWEPAGA